MKICVAQTKPIKGDMQRNIEKHKKVLKTAVAHHANLVIFPELSLTGYEPSLAKQLATHPDDGRFDDFQAISNSHQITIGVGVPTKSDAGICISMILFQPHQTRQIYSKKYLHADEEPFFVSGQNFSALGINQTSIGLAICYELSIAQHAQQARKSGAEVYIASVAKLADGVTKASQRLAEIATTYSIPVLMSNCVGPSEDFESAGGTAVWDSSGTILKQLDRTNEGILIYDTDTQTVISANLSLETQVDL